LKVSATALLSGFLLLVAIVFPAFAPNSYYLSVMSLAYIFAIAAVGLNLIVGYTGQLNLAHAGFMAIGAYAVGILTVDYGVPFWVTFILAGLLAALVGFVVGIVSLRLKGHYFAIFTLCVGLIMFLVIEKWESLTHGVVGVMDIPAATSIGPISFASNIGQYYLVLFFLVLGVWLMHRIVSSLLGRTFIAIRNSEDLAEALGINLMRNKILAFMISTFYAGIAGALYAGYVRFLGPDLARETNTFDMIAFTLVGGIGTLLGPVVGAVVVSWVTQSLQALQDYRMVVFGPLLILLIMFVPNGIIGSMEAWSVRRRASQAERARAKLQHNDPAAGVPPTEGGRHA
jgi:branched-chain amino acid transport system permease protein